MKVEKTHGSREFSGEARVTGIGGKHRVDDGGWQGVGMRGPNGRKAAALVVKTASSRSSVGKSRRSSIWSKKFPQSISSAIFSPIIVFKFFS